MHDLRAKIRRQEYIKKNIPLLLMALPCYIGLLCFYYLPMGGLVMAFQDFTYRKGIFGSEFIGLENFEYIFSNGEIFRTLGNTVFYHIAMTAAVTLSAIVLAVLLYFVRSKRAQSVFNTVTVIPYMVSYTIIAYIVYILLSNKGLVNNALVAMGLERIAWYVTAEYWPYILITVNVWFGTGIKAVYYYASLKAIDESLFEAAELDGASRWNKIWNVMLPAIAPTICIFLILDMGNLLASDFALYHSVPMDSSALYSATDVLATYTYRGLTSGNIGTTTALGMFTGVVTTVATLTVNLVVKKISPENSLF